MDSFVFNNKLTIRMTEDCYKSLALIGLVKMLL